MSPEPVSSGATALSRRMTAKLESRQEAAKLQRQVTSNPLTIGTAGEAALELEWEEWDGKGSYLQHCLAGSFAGVVEHTALYPVDTIKTQMQAYCADCPNQATCEVSRAKSQPIGMWTAMRQLMYGTASNSGAVIGNNASGAVAEEAASAIPKFGRLWRGVQTMMVGCIPAHALYFSSYEAVKSLFLNNSDSLAGPNGEGTDSKQAQNLGPLGAAVAGASAAFCHDLVMTPADTVKQRLQLGHYHGMTDAVNSILKTEGPQGLYRSFPITLLANLPYGMIMVTTNEYLREILIRRSQSNVLDVKTTMLAGCGAGMVAAAVTTPLDRVKTRLQTQGLGSAFMNTAAASSSSSYDRALIPPDCPKAQIASSAEQEAMLFRVKPRYQGLSDAFQSIVREEGWQGLFRGMTPRLMTHTPAIAISWTTYETAKMWLMSP